jgi:hypothetical protein
METNQMPGSAPQPRYIHFLIAAGIMTTVAIALGCLIGLAASSFMDTREGAVIAERLDKKTDSASGVNRIANYPPPFDSRRKSDDLADKRSLEDKGSSKPLSVRQNGSSSIQTPARPREQSRTLVPGDNSLTFADLITHLQSKGLQFVAFSREDLADLPLMQFKGTGVEKASTKLDATDFLQADLVLVETRASAGDARDIAAAQGDHGCSWGRFCFSGSPQMIQEIKTALVQQ